ncbi:MAG: PKD domain-containing protein [Chitinophagales bacterium]|nr:PKD domain-containing protein [Chitinophagales bacterium]
MRVTAENPCGTSIATIEPITTNQVPDANFVITPDSIACVNSVVTFTNNSIDGANVTNTGVCDTTTANNWTITPSTGWTIIGGNLGTNPLNAFNPNTYGSDVLQVRFTTVGTYQIKMRVQSKNQCGLDSIIKTVCIQPEPVPGFTIPTPGCFPATLAAVNTSNTLTSCGPTTYNWTVVFQNSTCNTTGTSAFVNGTTNSSIHPSIRLDSAGVYRITLTVTNKCGPFSTFQDVTVKGPPKISIDPIASLCSNGRTINPSLTFDNCYANPSPVTYLWSFPSGSPPNSPSANPGPVNYTGNGTYNMSVTATNQCGSRTASTSFSNNPTPIANAGTDTSICAGRTLTLGGNPTGTGAPGLTYQWSASTGTSPAAVANPVASPTITTTYTVTVTSSNGCTATDQIIVTVNQAPVISISPSTPSYCTGGSTTLTASGASTYTWNPATGLNATYLATVTANPTVTTTYTVTAISSNGCSATQQVTVTVNPPPIVNVNPSNPAICVGGSVSLAASGASTYSWTPATGLNTTTGATVIASPAATQLYTVTATDANGCTATKQVTVTVNALPAVSATASQLAICNGQSTTLTASGGASYTWTPATGLNTTTGATVIASPTVTTTYIVTGSSGLNCQDTGVVTVTVHPPTVVNVTPSSPAYCAGGATNLTASGATSYSWSPSTGLSATNLATVTANPTVTTTYTITGIDANGCSGTKQVTVTVNQPPVVTVTPPAPAVCIGGSITLTASGAFTYTWSPAGTLSSASGVTVTASPTVTQSYTVTGTDANGCTATQNVTVTVNALPAVSATATQYTICNGQSTTLTASGAGTYTWSPSTGLNTTSGATVTASPTVTTTYIVTGTSGLNCQDTGRVTITVNQSPVITINPSAPSICIGSSVSITASGAQTYVWSPATGLNATNLATVTASPTATLTYTVTGTDANNCTSTGQVTITVNPLPVVSAGNDLQFCNQSIPVPLSGSPAGGTWTGRGVITGNSYDPSAAGLGADTLIYSYTDVNGCVNRDTAIYTIITPQNIDAGTGFPVCVTEAPVNISQRSGAIPAGGIWSGTGVTGGTTFNPAVGGGGTQILTYTIGSGTCQVTDTINILINSQPVFAVPGDTICIGDTALLTATTAGLVYAWSGNGLLSATGIIVSAVPTTTSTYFVTGTSSSTGCADTITTTVRVNALPLVEAGPDVNLCNQPIAETLTGYSPTTGGTGIWTGSPYVTSSGVFTPNRMDTLFLYYSFTDLNGCSAQDSITVRIIDPLVADAGNNDTVCLNDALVLPVNNFPLTGGIWSGAGIVDPNTGMFNPSVAGAGLHTLQFSFGSGTCLTSDSRTILVHSLPNLTFTPAQPEACFQQDVTVSVSGAVTYAWSPGTGLNTTSGSTVIANLTNTTTFQVDAIDGNGCRDTIPLTITIHQLPIVDAGPDTTICNQSNFSTQLTGSPTGGIWSGSNFITSTGSFTPSGLPSDTGVYRIKYAYTDGFGCSDSSFTFVYVITPVFADAGPTDTFCLNDPAITLSGYTPLGGTWSGPGVTNGSAGVFNPAVGGAGLHSLVYSYGSGTCVTTDTTFITVHPLPQPAFSYNITCIGETTTFTDLSQPFSSSLVSWFWDFGDGSTSTVQSPIHTFSANGNYQVKLTVTNSNGCTNDTIITLTIHPLPTVTFSNPPIGCPDSLIQFTLTTVDAAHYQWDFGDGTTGTGPNPSHAYSGPGFYTIKMTAETAYGCQDSSTSSITIVDRPDANFTINPQSGCGPLEVSVRYLPANTNLSFSYTWSYGNGDTTFQAIPNDPVTYLPAASGADTTYIITLWVQSTLCQSLDIHRDTITVFGVPQIALVPDDTIGCSPLNVNFANNTAGNIDSMLVNFGDGNDTVIYGQYNVSHSYTNLGNSDTSFTAIISAYNSCGNTFDTLNFAVFPNSVMASINLLPVAACPHDEIVISNSSVGGKYIYYDLGDGIIQPVSDTSSLLRFSIPQPGTYTIVQHVYSGDSCSYDSISALVTIWPIPESIFEPVLDSQKCAGPIAVNFSNTSQNAVGYLWNFGDGDTSIETEPLHYYADEGTYSVNLIATNSFGCKDTLMNQVSVDHKDNGLYVPNALSPEFGDPVVRVFLPAGRCLATYHLQIFSTWGELVWESDKIVNEQPGEAWNGHHMTTGTLLPQDVYVWKIEATFLDDDVWEGKPYREGKVYKKVGSVTLIR